MSTDEGVDMPRARWLVLGALTLLTASIVLLDVTGVILDPEPEPVAPPPLQFASAEPVADPLTPVDVEQPAALSVATERAVGRALADPSLGGAVRAVVAAGDGTVLFAQQPDAAVTPASGLKLLTALSVLDALPPDARLRTSVVTGLTPQSIVLVGGGDATLSVDDPTRQEASTASLEELARLTARSLRASEVRSVRLSYDSTAFQAPEISPEWEPTYVTSGVIAPVTALMADQGLMTSESLARYPDPSKAAAEDFARLLEEQGVAVRSGVGPDSADPSATELAVVESPEVAVLVQRMLRDSDNQLAEALSRVAAVAAGFPASFTGGSEAMAAAAAAQGLVVDAGSVFDASGLSRQNRVSVEALGGALQVGATQDQFSPIVSGLPVAAVDGTLVDRYLLPPQDAAAGVVRAKTGTLTGVSTESGVTVTCDGDLVIFSFGADDVSFDTDAARDALDRAAAALSGCS